MTWGVSQAAVQIVFEYISPTPQSLLVNHERRSF